MAASSLLHYHLYVRSKVLHYIRERGLMRAGDRVCVAVSGGADSVALLRVLLELRTELGVVLAVAHFNHGLRGEDSEADEAFVADLARHHELEFFAGRADVREHALTAKLSVEAAGRELRYRMAHAARAGAAIRFHRDGAHPRRSGRDRAAEVPARRGHARAGGNLSKPCGCHTTTPLVLELSKVERQGSEPRSGGWD